jgi:serine/threonine protein kinase/2-phospho-L-lactate transferase/gluconeogenesis factor (CofD/UPF0052 family)
MRPGTQVEALCLGCEGHHPDVELAGGDVVLGPLLLSHVLGEGGQAYVLLAHHRNLRTDVAVKVVKPSHLALLTESLPKGMNAEDYLLREIRMLARLRHPHVILVHDARVEELTGSSGPHRLVYFVLDYAPGGTLADLLDRGGHLSLSRALHIALQTARAIRDLANRKIIHGDIKPANLLVSSNPHTREDWIRLTDFGAAQYSGRNVLCGLEWGTPPYLAPEVQEGRGRTSKSEVFSLGITLYEMLTRGAREGGSSNGVPAGHRSPHDLQAPRPSMLLCRRDVSPELGRFLARMVASLPSQRPTIDDVLDTLVGALEWTGALQDRLTFAFLPAGSVVRKEDVRERDIYFGLGNQVAPGIIDAHARSGSQSESSLLAKNTELLLDRASPEEWVTLWTHFYPDLDACVVTALARHLLKGGTVTEDWLSLVACVEELNSGHFPFRIAPERTPYAVFQAMTHMILNTERAPEANGISAAILRRGHELVDYLLRSIKSGRDIYSDDLFHGAKHEFQAELVHAQSDHRCYTQDLRRAQLYDIQLPTTDRKRRERAELLVVSQPRSIMFKVWARRDRLHSGSGGGFVATAVLLPDQRRAIISTDPSCGLCLHGLADALQREEARAREVPLQGPPRPGYGDAVDPWFDGRGTALDCTIVDAPGVGSALPQERILEIVLEFAQAGPPGQLNVLSRGDTTRPWKLRRVAAQQPVLATRVVTVGGGQEQTILLAGLRDLPVGVEVTAIVPPPSPDQLEVALEYVLALSPRRAAARPILLHQLQLEGALRGSSAASQLVGALTSQVGFSEALHALREILDVDQAVYPASLEAVVPHAGVRPAPLQLERDPPSVSTDPTLRTTNNLAADGTAPPVPGSVTTLGGEAPSAHPLALEAVEEADLVLMGPGAMATTVLIPAVSQALGTCRGRLVLVLDVVTSCPGATGWELIHWLESAIGRTLDGVVHNTQQPPPGLWNRLAREGQELLTLEADPDQQGERRSWGGDLLDTSGELLRLDERKLAWLLRSQLLERNPWVPGS